MKRIIIYCILFACATIIPIDRIDISDLEPIQAVWMYEEDGVICMKTDTADVGKGESVEQALQDMKLKSEGIVYLDTAEYLLVSEKVQNQIMHIRPYLKSNVKIAEWIGDSSIADAAQYMKAHKTGVKLKKWKSNVKLPFIPKIMNSEPDKRSES